MKMNSENNYTYTDLGNVSLRPRGDYDNTASYEYLDLVVLEGGSYICLAELGTTIKGVKPEAGKTTEYWQVNTLPGDLTPEYVAMHDNVVNKEKAAKESAEAAKVSENAAKTSESNAKTSENAAKTSEQAAENSKDSAAGYAKSAEESKKAAKLSEDNARNIVNGFDTHVNEKTDEAVNDIETARQDAVQVVQNATGAAVNAANDAEEAKNASKTSEDNARDSENKAKESETASKISETNAKASEEAVKKTLNEITAEGNRILEAIPDDYEEASRNAREAIRTKADAIVCTASGKNVVVTDSSDDYARQLKLYGKTKQEKTNGYQLFDANTDGETIIDNIKTVVGNKITMTTKKVGTGSIYTCEKWNIDRSYFKDADSVTLSVGKMTGFNGAKPTIVFRTADSNGNQIVAHNISESNASRTLQINDSVSQVHIILYSNAGGVCEIGAGVTYEDVMLNTGTEALPWEPFTGGKTSPSMEFQQPLENVGKYNENIGQMEVRSEFYGSNILPFDFKTVSINGITATEEKNNTISFSGTSTEDSYIFVQAATLKKGEKYILNGCPKGGSLATYTLYDDVGKNRDFGDGVELVGDDAMVRIYIRISKGVDVNGLVFKPMIRNAKIEDGTFKPYTKQSHTSLVGNGLNGIPLGTTLPTIIQNSSIHMSGVYFDEADGQYYISDTVDNEKLERVVRVYKKKVDIHSSGYLENGNAYGVIDTPDKLKYNSMGSMSDSTIEVFADGSINDKQPGRHYQNSMNMVFIGTPEDTLETMKEKYDGSEIMYILAEPYTEPLTAEEIESYESLHSNYHVTTVMNDCGAHMEFGYNADAKCYIDNLEKKHDEEIAELRTAIIALGGNL